MEKFAGDKKKGESLFMPWEKKIVAKYVDKIPKCIETYHLTLTTIIWSGLIILSGYLAQGNIKWLWLASIMIIFQYITDLFDGAVGRHRNTGLVKWGYYMDHLLDYFFLCSILICYAFFLPLEYRYIQFFSLAILAGYMVNSFLSFAATNEFEISYLKIGPTEIRLLFIIINILFIFFGKTYLATLIPYSFILITIGLIIVIYRTQKILWKIDMDNKNN
jgi:archaetidylinositol phosphate synthase